MSPAAAEPLGAQRQQATATDAEGTCARRRRSFYARACCRPWAPSRPEAHRAAGERAELPEDRRFLRKRDAERHHRSVVEHLAAELLLLVLLRVRLQPRIFERLLVVDEPTVDLDAPVSIERIDPEDRASAQGACGDSEIAVDDAAESGVVEDVFELPVEKLRLRVALHRPLKPAVEIQVVERHRAVLRHRRRKHAELLIAEHVGKRDLRPAEEVAAARDTEVDRRTAVEEQLFELALLLLVGGDERVRHRRLEVDDGAGRAKVGRGRFVERLFALEDVQAVFALVIGDKRDARRSAAFAEHNRRDIARQRVGELIEFARLRVERPDVVHHAVLRHFGVDRLGGIGRGGGEHQRLGVDKLRAALVVRAEGELRALARGEIQTEQLFVAAHAFEEHDRTCRRAPTSARSRRNHPS